MRITRKIKTGGFTLLLLLAAALPGVRSPAIAGAHGADDIPLRARMALFERLLAAHPGAVRLEWLESLVSLLLGLGKGKRTLPHLELLAEKSDGQKRLRWQELLLYQYMEQGLKEKALGENMELSTTCAHLSTNSTGSRKLPSSFGPSPE